MSSHAERILWLRALIAFMVLPGLCAGLLPPVLLALDPWRLTEGLPLAGSLLLAAGLVVLLWCVRDFLAIGRGTLAPWDPPRRLVVVGLYRYMRNPMYVGVVLIVAALALKDGSPLLGGYAALLAIVFHVRVVVYEEPALARQFAGDYAAYCRKVRRWLPGRPTDRAST
ncbi:MAG: isoprenylcysteine carboxylmethyltransferase family protein [Deltaproteobacteria bacterium]|nr:isoprenylcysteine carboxylmethyltransferase family protein [Deltaproteobacteria bacterium]